MLASGSGYIADPKRVVFPDMGVIAGHSFA